MMKGKIKNVLYIIICIYYLFVVSLPRNNNLKSYSYEKTNKGGGAPLFN